MQNAIPRLLRRAICVSEDLAELFAVFSNCGCRQERGSRLLKCFGWGSVVVKILKKLISHEKFGVRVQSSGTQCVFSLLTASGSEPTMIVVNVLTWMV
jgi:hypothetical protein